MEKRIQDLLVGTGGRRGGVGARGGRPRPEEL